MKMNRRTQPTRWSAGTLLLLLTGVLLCLFSGKSYAQQVQTFTTVGGQTWTAPPGVTRILVETWGGGGRGGTATPPGGLGGTRAAAGGGGGAYSRSVLTVGTGTYYINVGAGSTSAGSAGGDSWFHDVNSVPTSTDGVLAKGGGSVSDNNTAGANGGAENLGFGDLKYSGGTGGDVSGNTSGGGGSSAGT